MERKPILLSKNTCALILMYNRPDEIFDVVAGEYENFDGKKVAEEAAKEFVNQLQMKYNGHFVKALKRELQKVIEEHYTV